MYKDQLVAHAGEVEGGAGLLHYQVSYVRKIQNISIHYEDNPSRMWRCWFFSDCAEI